MKFLYPCILVCCFSLPLFGQNVMRTEFADVPIMFTENKGQWDDRVQYAGMDGSPAVFFTRSGIVCNNIPAEDKPALGSLEYPYAPEPLTVSFVDPSKSMELVPGEQFVTVSNFFRTADSSQWASGARNYHSLLYHNVWEGVDVEYTQRDDKLLQRIAVRDAEALARVRFAANGMSQLRLTDVQSRGNTVLGKDDIQLRRQGKTLSFAAPDTLPEGGLILCTEYSSAFIGVSETAYFTDPFDVDDDGNMYIGGLIRKLLTPPVNSLVDPNSAPSFPFMLMKIGCDGKTIIYNTYLGASLSHVSAQSDGSVVLGTDYVSWYYTQLLMFPITPDAKRPDTLSYTHRYPHQNLYYRHDAGIVKLSPSGDLVYGSWIGTDGPPRFIHGIELDQNDNIYVHGSMMVFKSDSLLEDYRIWRNDWNGTSFDPHPFMNTHKADYNVTDTLYEKNYIIKLSPDCKTTLYGTYMPDIGPNIGSWDQHLDVAITSSEDIIIARDVFDDFFKRQDISLAFVNAVHNTPLDYDTYIFKLNHNGVDVDFAGYTNFRTSFMSTSQGYEEFITCDSKDNCIVVGYTDSPGLPTVNAVQDHHAGNNDAYVMKLSPTGDLIGATYLGSAGGYENAYTVTIDRHDNVCAVLLGTNRYHTTGSVIERTHTISELLDPNIHSLVILSEDLSSVLYSCPLGVAPHARSDKYGYLYFNSVDSYGYGADRRKKAWNAQIEDDSNDQYPFAIKLRPPIEDWALPEWSITTTVDTIQYSPFRRIYDPKKFTLTATLQNISNMSTAENLTAEIILPPNVTLDPPTQQKKIDLGALRLAPFETTTLTWTVTLDNLRFYPDSLRFGFYCEYTWPELQTNCPVPCSNGEKVIYISQDPSAYDLACMGSMSDTLKYDAQSPPPADTTMNLTYTIRNNGDDIAHLDYVEIDLPKEGVALAPGEDKRKYIGALHPGQDLSLTWVVTIETWQTGREVAVQIRVVDSLWFDALLCEKLLIIEGKSGVECNVELPDVVLYEMNNNTTLPSPIPATLELTNTLAVTSLPIVARIDLQASPFLTLMPGEDSVQTLAALAASTSGRLTWNLSCSGITKDESLPVRFRYRLENDSAWYECMAMLDIQAREDLNLVTCAITSMDTLSVLNQNYSLFSVRYTLSNNGNIPLDVAELELVHSASFATADSLVRLVSPVDPQSSLLRTWHMRAFRSSYDRYETLTVIARDTNGDTITTCEHSIFLPGIKNFRCFTDDGITVHFDVSKGAYDPDPVNLRQRLINDTDTLLTNVELSVAVQWEHLAFAPNMDSVFTIDSISTSGEHATVLAFDVIPQHGPTITFITYTYRCDQYPEWRTCDLRLYIEPAVYTGCAECIAGGIDSLWIAGEGSIPAPNPFQAYAAVTNTCEIALYNLECTMRPEQKLVLVSPQTATQTIDRLEPGDTAWVFWDLQAFAAGSGYDVDWRVTVTSREAPLHSECSRAVHVERGKPAPLVLSKNLLYFKAVRDGALPAEKTVTVLSGTTPPYDWTSQYPSWLHMYPALFNASTNVYVYPQTTALPIGRYWGRIDILAEKPNSPQSIRVIYDITDVTSVAHAYDPAASIALHANYPNPFTTTTTVTYTTQSAQPVTLTVYNTLGIPVRTIQCNAQPGENTVQLDGLKAGMYMLVLQGKEGVVTRRMIAK